MTPLAQRPTDDFEQARDLLARVLAAFGHDGSWFVSARGIDARALTNALVGAPRDAEEYAELHRREVGAIAPTATGMIRAIEQLLPATAVLPKAMRRRMRLHVENWNAVVVGGDYKTIPTLCESCGAPVFARRSNDGEPSTACSDRCQGARQRREKRRSQA